MPFEFIVHHEYKLVYRKVWGVYGVEDSIAVHEYWDELSGKGEIGNYDELIDLSEVTEYGISIEQIRSLANHYRILAEARQKAGVFKPKKIAYVIPSPAAYGTGRVYGALIEEVGMNFQVFNVLHEACDWLCLTPDVVSKVLVSKR